MCELHLGGGTPTFFSPANLKRLITGILDTVNLHPVHGFSFEGHPNNTTAEHLQCLFDLGFDRVSYGVQDLGIKTQKAINRIQPYENVVKATETARHIGYTSVNFDLIYGLPFQNQVSIRDTVQKTLLLKPDRIAFYSYAHVPWKRPGQRAYSEADLPENDEKRKLYETGKSLLLEAGYTDVGMDHFALKGDDLYEAFKNKTMHRNFMGYTHSHTDLLIGLGVSAISDAGQAYAQNVKNMEDYKKLVDNGHLALDKGHFMSGRETIVRKQILDIACKGELFWEPGSISDDTLIQLQTMQQEGLVVLFCHGLKVTTLGMAFLRNICAAFDQKLMGSTATTTPQFSKGI